MTQPSIQDTTSQHCACCAYGATLLSLVERMEAKLDALIEAMADEPEEDQSATLDDAGETRRPVTL